MNDDIKNWARFINNAIGLISTAAVVAGLLAVGFGWLHSWRGALIAALSAMLAYSLGGFMGFLFGLPRAAKQDDAEPLQANTSLDRIVDWLTTMIVGATLVNLKFVFDTSTTAFRSLSVAVAFGSTAPIAPPSAVVGALLIVPFAVAGFLQVYVWARSYLTKALQDLGLKKEVAQIKQIVEQDQIAKEKVVEKVQSLQKAAIYNVRSGQLERLANSLTQFGASPATIGEILKRYSTATGWDDEPFGNWGSDTADSYKMAATVRADQKNPLDPFEVFVTISRGDGKTFKGAVALFLHNSFDEPFLIDPIESKEFKSDFWCSEAFIVGALVLQHQGPNKPVKEVRLALDLAKLPNRPDGFN